MPHVYWGQLGVTFDGGYRYDDSPQPPIPNGQTPNKPMKAHVALNTHNLQPRPKLAKLQTAITKLTGNADMTNPNPTLVSAQAKHDLALSQLNALDAEENDLKTSRLEAAAAVADAMSDYGQLGKFVDNKAGGNAAKITNAGFDVAAEPSPIGAMGQVLELA